jgi:hypothetical protein
MYRRRDKESHRDTITYEIDMFDFCARRLRELSDSGADTADQDVYLEGFLLHCRNLFRFFDEKNAHPTDLTCTAPGNWTDRAFDAGRLNAFIARAVAFDGAQHEDISAYVQHCTMVRHERTKEWDVHDMYREMDALITEFESMFPRTLNDPVRERFVPKSESGRVTTTAAPQEVKLTRV